MNSVNIVANDLSDAFFLCCKECLTNGYEYKIDRGSYAGTRRKEFDFVIIQVKHPGTRPLAPFVPEGVPSPTTNDVIENYLTYLMSPEKQPKEEYTYGTFLCHQIEEVIRCYKEDGYNNNQLCMKVGDENSIYLKDPPCLQLIDTRIRYGKLHFVVYFRSWDLFAGFPVNLGGLQLLKEHMADSIGVEDGELIAVSKGLHLYEHFWKYAEMLVGGR